MFSNSPGVTNLTLSGIETISFGVNYSTTGTQIDVAINTNLAVRYTRGAADVRGHRGGYIGANSLSAQRLPRRPCVVNLHRAGPTATAPFRIQLASFAADPT